MGKQIELSVIVPCFNEEDNLNELVVRFEKVFNKIDKPCELIIVDDFSSDNSLKVIRSLSSNFDFIKVIQHKKNLGMAEAWFSGIRNSNGFYTAIIDADLQYQPEDIFNLYKRKKDNLGDVIQGARTNVFRKKDIRFLYSYVLGKLLNFIFKMHLKDNKSGFILTTRDIFHDIINVRFKYKYFQTFLLVSAHSKKYSIHEKNVLFHDRNLGKSFISFFPYKIFLNLFFDFIKAIYEFKISDKQVSILTSYKNKIKKEVDNKKLNVRSFFSSFLLNIYFYTMPLHAWILSRNTKTYFNELSYTQWLSKKEIESLQLEKLKKIINHAYNNCDYYRNLFDENNINPRLFNSLDDLKKIPFLTKDIVRNNINYGMLSNNIDPKNILKIVTSGSTGEPFVCFADKFQLEMRWASTLRSLEWTGYRFGDRCARLWHQTIGMGKVQIIKEKIDALISRRIFIPAFSIKSNNIDKFMKKLKEYKPVLIDGYAESFNFLAEYIKSNKSFNIKPKALVSSAQILPDQSREIIEKNFNSKVYDKYGSREFSGIAYESCEKNIHLVVAESYIVEIIKKNKDAKPGEIGEVVVTDLNNLCMPLIRYKIGDLAEKIDDNYKSPCGRNLPAIGKIHGRSQGIIFGTNGSFVPSAFFGHLFKEYGHLIKQYQVIQEKKGQILLKIVKNNSFTSKLFKNVLSDLHKVLGKNTKIIVKYLDEIPMVRTGKQRGTINKLNIDFQKL